MCVGSRPDIAPGLANPDTSPQHPPLPGGGASQKVCPGYVFVVIVLPVSVRLVFILSLEVERLRLIFILSLEAEGLR